MANKILGNELDRKIAELKELKAILEVTLNDEDKRFIQLIEVRLETLGAISAKNLRDVYDF